MTTSTLFRIAPAEVHQTLGRYLLADGLDLVFDFEKSHGAWLHDAKTGREHLDFCTFFASSPIGYNHPKMKDPDFLATLHRVAQLKPTLADIYTVEYAQFVDTLGRLARPSYMKYVFFIEGGALGVENALKAAFDWKVRRNKAKGVPGDKGTQVLHFQEAFHGRTGYTLSLTNTDPVKTAYFPKFPWPRVENPKLRFPVTPEVERDVIAAEQRSLAQIEKAFTDNPYDIAAIIIEPIQAEGGHNHFGIQPDALAFGKKTQVCGFLAGPKVDEEPENVFKVPSRINSTWGGGLTDMVRFGRYLEIIDEDRLVENARVVGDYLLSGLRELERASLGKLRNARGRGLMIAFDLPAPDLRAKAHEALLANGLLLLTCGERSIRFRPPLNLSVAEADRGLEIVRKTLKEL